MNYCTCFYIECPATGMEVEIEIIFTCDQEEEKEMFWGFPVSVPASGEVEVLEVFKDGVEWLDYPDLITKELHDQKWTRCSEIHNCKKRHSISKPIKKLPCKRRLAA